MKNNSNYEDEWFIQEQWLLVKHMSMICGLILGLFLGAMYFSYQLGKDHALQDQQLNPGQIYIEPETERQI